MGEPPNLSTDILELFIALDALRAACNREIAVINLAGVAGYRPRFTDVNTLLKKADAVFAASDIFSSGNADKSELIERCRGGSTRVGKQATPMHGPNILEVVVPKVLREAVADSDCPSCGGLNTSCPRGCGRDPLTGELDGSDLRPAPVWRRLLPFVKHDKRCVLNGHWMEASDNDCDCGLADAIRLQCEANKGTAA